MPPQPLIAGNWKMFGTAASLSEAKAVAKGAAATTARVALCPPATLMHRMSEALAGSNVLVGGQDVHWEDDGAFTGDVSAAMLADAGARLVILGHSERRTAYGESNAVVAKKAQAAVRAGLEPIICVGESLEQRKAGETEAFVTRQVRESIPDELVGKPFSIAYEPIWAIGTGLTPTIEQIAEVHAAIRATLNARLRGQGGGVPILYGGSVKPSNAAEILAVAEVGGALVGGASLKAVDFLAIVGAV
jgi:triosephosphate isomerase (TIM)